MSGPKVVQLQPSPFSDPIAAMKEILKDLESGDLPACVTGVLVMANANGEIDTFGFGPKSDDFQCIGLMALGQQVIMNAATGGQ